MSEEAVVETAEQVVSEVTPAEATPVEATALGGESVDAEPKFSNEEIFDMFKGSLGEDMKGHSYLDKYKTGDDFVKAGINHQSSLTKKASEYFESEDPTVVAERNKLMGVPENAEGYTINKELSTGAELGEEGEAMFRSFATENAVPDRLANPMIEFHSQIVTKIHEQYANKQVEQKDTASEALHEEWKGDTFDHNTKQIQSLMTELGISQEAMTVPLGNNVEMLKALHEKVVPLFGEDKLIEGTMSQTNVSAGERMKQLNVDMFRTETNTPEYKALLAEKAKLMGRMK